MENLSRGMQQKVALARALLTSPVLLLLDEPTTGLDPRSKLEVQEFVREIRSEHDATILLCTHDLDEAEALADRLDVTVLLDPENDTEIPEDLPFPVAKGHAVRAAGHFGAYDVVLDRYRAPRESGGFASPRDGAVSRCDLILDLSAGAPLFPVHEARDGYFKPPPDEVDAAIEAAGELVGEFDKPRFITFEAGLCAHSRNRRIGCTRCLDLCPTGAITPGKDGTRSSL